MDLVDITRQIMDEHPGAGDSVKELENIWGSSGVAEIAEACVRHHKFKEVKMSVTRAELEQLAGTFKSALEAERKARWDLALEKARESEVARAVGIVDGKNAEIRADQLTIYLSMSKKVADLEELVAYRSAEVERLKALIKLTTAWLYSQSPDR